jgi:hypothetical protein
VGEIMQTREIAKHNWQSFFDQVSRTLRGKLIQIEIDSLKVCSADGSEQIIGFAEPLALPPAN